MTRMTNQRAPHPDDLMVECWCHRSWVWIPAADVRAGRTESCGMARCHPPERVPPTLT